MLKILHSCFYFKKGIYLQISSVTQKIDELPYQPIPNSSVIESLRKQLQGTAINLTNFGAITPPEKMSQPSNMSTPWDRRSGPKLAKRL
jgi:hypothetical protein